MSPPVLWLGGSACAGKTTVAGLLARRHGLLLVHADDLFEAHRRRADPTRHARFLAVAALPPAALWAEPVAERAAELLAFYEDEFEMLREDLAILLPGGPPILVEGVGLLPDLVAAADPAPRAAWLIAEPAWRRRACRRRGPFVADLLAAEPDPDATFERWMARDDEVARHVEAEARRLRLPVVRVGEGRGVAEVAAEAAAALGLEHQRVP